MLIKQHDAAFGDDEWRNFLAGHDFGQFVASGRNRDVPIIVPTHFIFDGIQTILFHLARANPVWKALEENPKAILSVAGAYAYIPTGVNAGENEPAGYGVPTSYYAAVQAVGVCESVDGDQLASILASQLAHFQPEGGHAEVEMGDNPYARLLPAIRGIRLEVSDVRAKFKFGGNKTVEHRLRIAKWLAGQDTPLTQEARSQLIRRLESPILSDGESS
ncbi:MAG TPA: FMN-binding negative transcriptional regulator [Chloroflexota bacterium]|jgi:transcriptional regulator|nr:FMN-binding negative transcriptional regulator [Chloroflexota bacterium]